MVAEREDFCHRLKSARESSGLTLEAISDASKIQVSVLAGLERGDVSRWPTGIFRRSFIREYAAAIGLPSDQVVSEFCQLFPDDGTVPVSRESWKANGDGLRLTLAPDQTWRSRFTFSRIDAIAALLDAVIVLLAGLAAVRIASVPYGTVTAVIALTYYSIATAFTGGTLALFWLSSQRLARWRPFLRQPETPSIVERPRLVFRRLDVPHAPDLPLQLLDIVDESPTQNLRAAP